MVRDRANESAFPAYRRTKSAKIIGRSCFFSGCGIPHDLRLVHRLSANGQGSAGSELTLSPGGNQRGTSALDTARIKTSLLLRELCCIGRTK